MRGTSFIIFLIAAAILIIFFYYTTLLYSFVFGRSGSINMHRALYECGFRAIPDMRGTIELNFAVLCLIFLIYDMELILLVPLALNAIQLPLISLGLGLIVIAILGLSY